MEVLMNIGADGDTEMLFVMWARVKVAGYYSKELVAPPLKWDEVVLPELQSPKEVFNIKFYKKRKAIISLALDGAPGSTRKHCSALGGGLTLKQGGSV